MIARHPVFRRAMRDCVYGNRASNRAREETAATWNGKFPTLMVQNGIDSMPDGSALGRHVAGFKIYRFDTIHSRRLQHNDIIFHAAAEERRCAPAGVDWVLMLICPLDDGRNFLG